MSLARSKASPARKAGEHGLAAQRKEFGMAKRIEKQHLPVKSCPTCNRPFVWRKKWAKVWGEVKYCSDACRAQRRATRGQAPTALDG